ncbi:MAG: GFA family protein [Planktomarina sp.]
MARIGACYCGAVTLDCANLPNDAAYCHCTSCRRWTGAAAPAFVGANADDLKLSGPALWRNHGDVRRANCRECGSPLAAQFPYLPGKSYIPVGVLDDASQITPTIHCHTGEAIAWALPSDGLQRCIGSCRDAIMGQST